MILLGIALKAVVKIGDVGLIIVIVVELVRARVRLV